MIKTRQHLFLYKVLCASSTQSQHWSLSTWMQSRQWWNKNLLYGGTSAILNGMSINFPITWESLV